MATFSPGTVCLPTLLALSGSTLRLEIRQMTVSFTAAEAVASALKPHMHRLGVLHLVVDGWQTMNALHTSLLLRTPAPMLEEFALHRTFAPDAEPLVLLSNIFQGHAPQLERLTLGVVQLNADGAYPAFAHVTNLQYFRGIHLLPELFPRLTDCAFVHESGLAPSAGPLTHPLRRLSFISPSNFIVALLAQLGPLALVETREMDIDCPYSADYVVRRASDRRAVQVQDQREKSPSVHVYRVRRRTHASLPTPHTNLHHPTRTTAYRTHVHLAHLPRPITWRHPPSSVSAHAECRSGGQLYALAVLRRCNHFCAIVRDGAAPAFVNTHGTWNRLHASPSVSLQ
ncbi:hypothetical protein EXIGLDRAFT_724305 [Exidia glandulosa HHB12029]|uniref:Uncharacterized protein n=1 Tax=Exidia glandulosa HHB12029 TaxID=1314781 RepID=A0A165MU09_EXIGL|nr:hypothetical protein EXIGLDRAFT_724305 [Exidia glandulosa HHB12029]